MNLDCKTVGFFLKISKEIGKACRKSLTRAKRASLTRSPGLALCFQPRSRPFVWLLARCVLEYAKIRTVLQSKLNYIFGRRCKLKVNCDVDTVQYELIKVRGMHARLHAIWFAILWKKLFQYSTRITYLPSFFSCVHPFFSFTKLWSSVRGLSSVIHWRYGCRKSVVEAFWKLLSILMYLTFKLKCSRCKRLSRLAFMQCNAQICL